MLRCFRLLETLGNTGGLIKASGPLCWTTILQKHSRSYIYLFPQLWHTYCITCLGRYSWARSELTMMQSAHGQHHDQPRGIKMQTADQQRRESPPHWVLWKSSALRSNRLSMCGLSPYFQTEIENWEKWEGCSHVRQPLRPPCCEFPIFHCTANQSR